MYQSITKGILRNVDSHYHSCARKGLSMFIVRCGNWNGGFIIRRYNDEITRTGNAHSMKLSGLVSQCDTLFSTLDHENQGKEIDWELSDSQGLLGLEGQGRRVITFSTNGKMGHCRSRGVRVVIN